MNPELRELLRKCLVMGGPLAADAALVIRTHYQLYAYSFLYPDDVFGDNAWRSVYLKPMEQNRGHSE